MIRDTRTSIFLPSSMVFISLLLLCLSSTTAQAQNRADSLAIEEVVVTARKRFDTVHDIPISMSVVRGAELQANSIVRLEDLSAKIPNMVIGEAVVTSQLFIRGVGSGVNQGFEQTVGTYVDGIYHGRGQLSRSPFFDIERVEVLKGPQSILFGKNTVAGAISTITADPTEELDLKLSALYEPEHNERKIEGFISGPLTPVFNGRIGFRASEMDGWLGNNSPGKNDEPASDEQAARISLSYTGSENLRLIAKLSLVNFETEGRQQQILKCSPNFVDTLTTYGYSDDCKEDFNKRENGDYINASNGSTGYDFSEQWADTDTETFSLELDYSFGDYELSSLTGYTAYDYEEHTDNDYSELSVLAVTLLEDFDQFSEELRLMYVGSDKYEWLIGLYGQVADMDNEANIHASLLQFPAFGLPDTGADVNSFDQESTTLAAFAQLEYHLSEQWLLTLGARYTAEKKEVEKELILTELGGRSPTADPDVIAMLTAGIGLSPHHFKEKRSENSFTPNVILQYTPDFDRQYYLSVSKGFKGGGFDAILSNGNYDGFEFEEEEVIAYELGAKYRFMDGRANLKIAIFRSDFEDVQTSAFDDESLGFTLANAGEIRSQGLEIESEFMINEFLSSGLSYAYLDSEYTDFEGAQCYNGQTAGQGCIDRERSLSDQETQFSPENSATLYLELHLPLAENRLISRLEAIYSDDYAVANDLDPNLQQDSFTKLNLRMGYQMEHWEVALIGKNLTDENTSQWANDVPLFGQTYFIYTERSRSTAMQVTYSY